jgi:hypothetical protein
MYCGESSPGVVGVVLVGLMEDFVRLREVSVEAIALYRQPAAR